MSTTTTSKNRNSRIPDPVYAVAGASEYAYRQLRKLPGVAAELREELPHRVAELRTEIPARVEQMRTDLTTRRVPEAVNTLLAGGFRLYGDLVARGERMVNRGRRETATAIAPEGDVVKKPTGPKPRARAAATPAKKATRTTATTRGRAGTRAKATSRRAA